MKPSILACAICAALALQQQPPTVLFNNGDSDVEMCECTEEQTTGSACKLEKCHLHQERPAASEEMAGALQLLDASRLYVESGDIPQVGEIAQQSFYCMDDRVEKPVLTTPGGDLGEFILALDSYKDLTPDREITQHMVDTWLQSYLQTFPVGDRKLVMCIDDAALHHLEAELQVEGLSLTTPPDHLHDELLRALEQVDNVGDTHLRLLLKEPDNYHVDPMLVKMSMRAFWSMLWDGENPSHSRVALEQLAGTPHPAAFLEVSTTQVCEQAGMAPLMQPRTKNLSVLVSNLDAVTARREELAEFFAVKLGAGMPVHIDKEILHKRLDRHGLAALELTGGRVARDLPFYSLTFA